MFIYYCSEAERQKVTCDWTISDSFSSFEAMLSCDEVVLSLHIIHLYSKMRRRSKHIRRLNERKIFLLLRIRLGVALRICSMWLYYCTILQATQWTANVKSSYELTVKDPYRPFTAMTQHYTRWIWKWNLFTTHCLQESSVRSVKMSPVKQFA